jgi:hypothetical protein
MPIETNCTSPRLMRLDRLHAVHCRSLPAQEVQALLDYCVTSELDQELITGIPRK